MDGIFPEWLNANSGRAYPLAENSSRKDISGNIKIPDSLIVAAQINMLPYYATGGFFIQQVSVSPSTVVISVGFQPLTGAARLISYVSVPVATHRENSTYPFVGSGQDTSVLGSITVGLLADTLESVPGIQSFSSTATPFEVSALMVSSPALEAVEVYEGGALVGRFPRVLKLRAGENIRLSRVNGDANTIRIDASPGANLTNPGDCENVVPLPPPIRTINGEPSIEGNFNIDGGKCIACDAVAGLLQIKDLCSQSCCGCSELQVLMAAQKLVEAQATQLQNQINIVVTQQAAMLTNLASQQQ
jgi:hypothetical protein